MAEDFATRLRSRERLVGYWITLDSPPSTERIAAAGYDYLCLDLQHGLLDYAGALAGVMAAELGGSTGVVRVPVNDSAWIGKALDTGARAVIVPLVDTAEDAERAARACRYPPAGGRSFGPARSSLRIGPAPREADAQVACIVMIETATGLANAAEICGVPGVDAVYVGPSDLSIAVGGDTPQYGWKLREFSEALATIRSAAATAGVACGLHVTDGTRAARAFADGFDFVSISNDLTHLEAYTRAELAKARTP
ncbi:MAG TPA: aldolase/citrate lyase family protein [Pseudonocardiaceae bacterium]|nr:aldolase/citrate lyase family protein [Pseudonocardiaceae bacterium]